MTVHSTDTISSKSRTHEVFGISRILLVAAVIAFLLILASAILALVVVARAEGASVLWGVLGVIVVLLGLWLGLHRLRPQDDC